MICALTGAAVVGSKPKQFMKNFKKVTAVLMAVSLLLLSFASFAYAGTALYLGDADSDGQISASDARIVLRYATDIDIYSKAHLKLSDTDNDNILTASDARTILRWSVGLDNHPGTTVYVCDTEYKNLLNGSPENPLYTWNVPPMPEVKAPSGTFTFTVYGFGHGVGLSMYGALSMEDYGYDYNDILTHYYPGTEIKNYGYYPQATYYPTTGYIDTEQLVARITYQEIYGITNYGAYEEALKAQAVAVFTILAYNNFYVSNKWDVGICSPVGYYNLPYSYRQLIHSIMGEYLAVEGHTRPIMSVYSGLAAGMTASSQDIWGGELSYLQPVESPFDMDRSGFITTRTYTVNQMYNLIKSYDYSIRLSDDPADWLEIIEHSESIDSERGYVTKIRVGNKILKGSQQFHVRLMRNQMRSSCFYITYTP